MAILDGEEVVMVTLVDDAALPAPVYEDLTFPGRVAPSSGGTYNPSAEGERGYMKESDADAAVIVGSVLINRDNTMKQIEDAIAASAAAQSMPAMASVAPVEASESLS